MAMTQDGSRTKSPATGADSRGAGADNVYGPMEGRDNGMEDDPCGVRRVRATGAALVYRAGMRVGAGALCFICRIGSDARWTALVLLTRIMTRLCTSADHLAGPYFNSSSCIIWIPTRCWTV